MTDGEIQSLLKLCDEATPGPWSAKDWRICANVDDPTKFEYVLDTASNKKSRNQRNANNASFIAAAREALPTALRELQAARQLLFRIQEWDHMDTAADGAYWRGEIQNLLGDKR